ncbi:MAG: DUF3575 domain-containing protein [Muribaculaceae bacterium]
MTSFHFSFARRCLALVIELSIVLSALAVPVADSAEPDSVAIDSSFTEIVVDFRVNSTTIDPAFRNNRRNLDDIVALVRQLMADSKLSVTGIAFCGSASPEGRADLNQRLARGRLDALEAYIRRRVSIPDSVISRDDSYIPWNYLRQQITSSDVPYKTKVLAVLTDDAIFGADNASIISELKNIDQGAVWSDLNRSYFAAMRNATAVFGLQTMRTFHRPKPEPEPEPKPEPQPEPEPVMVSQPEHEPEPQPSPTPEPQPQPVAEIHDFGSRHLFVKTNVVGLGMLVANVAAEIELSNHLSVALPISYSAWDYFSSTRKFRTFAIQPELRYHFSNTDGLFVGAHFGLAYYNFAFGGDFRTQDHDGSSPAIGGGISLGYRLPISANRRWRIEFAVGAGVYCLHHDKFYNTDPTKAGMLALTERKTRLGLDQAALNIIYTFDLNKWTR